MARGVIIIIVHWGSPGGRTSDSPTTTAPWRRLTRALHTDLVNLFCLSLLAFGLFSYFLAPGSVYYDADVARRRCTIAQQLLSGCHHITSISNFLRRA